MTPFEIDILMHYCCSPEDHSVVSSNPPIWRETLARFVSEGLLEIPDNPSEYSATYKATDRCRAYIKGLCNVPLPVQKWVMPE